VRAISEHTLYIDDDDEGGQFLAQVKPASEQAVEQMLDVPQGHGRSNWVWVRLQNGDLLLGFFPQQEMYVDCTDRLGAP
jgi:hypothetical protein